MIEVISFGAFMKVMVRDPEGREAGHPTAEGRLRFHLLYSHCAIPAYPSMNTATERSLNVAFR
jgi:hypothetical protein